MFLNFGLLLETLTEVFQTLKTEHINFDQYLDHAPLMLTSTKQEVISTISLVWGI